MKHGTIILGLMILVLASCYLPQNPVNLDGNESVDQLSVMTDKSRDQGVYVNESGDTFDIVSEEGPDGEIVRCVEALDIVPVGSGDGVGSKSFGGHGPVKALILGKRHDGYPGVWEVQNDDAIWPVSYNESGDKSSKAGDSCEVEWLIHGFFGWVYHVESLILGPDTEGGFILVGYAENTKGIDFGGKWEIEEETTVAVYWRLEKKKNGHYRISRARIIGEPKENYTKWKKDKDKEFPRYKRYRHSIFVHFLRYLFASYKFFFLDSFETYLVDVTNAEYDENADKYFVTGHVEGAIDTVTPVTKGAKSDTVAETENELPTGTAAIAPNGEITITVDGGGNGGGDTYERIVIDAYSSIGGGEPSIEVKLFNKVDDQLQEVPGDEDLKTTRVVMSKLPSGTYYIQVTSPAAGDQAYALRVLAPVGAEPLPIVPGLNESDAPYEPDDDDPDKNTILLGNDNYVNRYFANETGDTVDWLKLVLQ